MADNYYKCSFNNLVMQLLHAYDELHSVSDAYDSTSVYDPDADLNLRKASAWVSYCELRLLSFVLEYSDCIYFRKRKEAAHGSD